MSTPVSQREVARAYSYLLYQSLGPVVRLPVIIARGHPACHKRTIPYLLSAFK